MRYETRVKYANSKRWVTVTRKGKRVKVLRPYRKRVEYQVEVTYTVEVPVTVYDQVPRIVLCADWGEKTKALHVMIHESGHMGGNHDERADDCWAMGNLDWFAWRLRRESRLCPRDSSRRGVVVLAASVLRLGLRARLAEHVFHGAAGAAGCGARVARQGRALARLRRRRGGARARVQRAGQGSRSSAPSAPRTSSGRVAPPTDAERGPRQSGTPGLGRTPARATRAGAWTGTRDLLAATCAAVSGCPRGHARTRCSDVAPLTSSACSSGRSRSRRSSCSCCSFCSCRQLLPPHTVERSPHRHRPTGASSASSAFAVRSGRLRPPPQCRQLLSPARTRDANTTSTFNIANDDGVRRTGVLPPPLSRMQR